MQHNFSSQRLQNSKKMPRLLKKVSSIYYQPITRQESRKIKRSNSFSERTLSEGQEFECFTPTGKECLFFDDYTVSESCMVCCEQNANVVLINCGHGGICQRCSASLKSLTNKCHICRAQITDMVEIDNETKQLAQVRCVINKALDW